MAQPARLTDGALVGGDPPGNAVASGDIEDTCGLSTVHTALRAHIGECSGFVRAGDCQDVTTNTGRGGRGRVREF